MKTFEELYGMDVTGYVSKKPMGDGKEKQDYIGWADMLVLLHESGAEKVTYGNVLNAAGHSVFLSPNGKCPEVRVFVEVDGDRRELTYPVISGFYAVPPDKLSQSHVHNATQRAFVKCVSVNWGLGLSLWQKEERAEAKRQGAEDVGCGTGERLRRAANRAFAKLGSYEEVEKASKLKMKDIKFYIEEGRAIDKVLATMQGIADDHE